MGELVNARFPIPEGFVVTTEAYAQFVDLSGIRTQISEALANLDYSNSEQVNAAAEKVTGLILSTKVPSEVSTQIKTAYEELCRKKDIIISGKIDIPVRITTSNFSSDPIDGVHGVTSVVQTIQKLWASLYIPENLRQFNQEGKALTAAVIVQKLMMSEKAGIMHGEGDKILIEAGWGLADAVKSNSVMSDKYLVSGSEVVGKEINDQDWMYRAMPDGTMKKTDVLGSQRNIQKLTDQEILRLAEMYGAYSSYSGSAVQAEWSIIGRDMFLVEATPISEPVVQQPETPEPETQQYETPEPEPTHEAQQPETPEPEAQQPEQEQYSQPTAEYETPTPESTPEQEYSAPAAEPDDLFEEPQAAPEPASEPVPEQETQDESSLQPISEYEQQDVSQQISAYERDADAEPEQEPEPAPLDPAPIRAEPPQYNSSQYGEPQSDQSQPDSSESDEPQSDQYQPDSSESSQPEPEGDVGLLIRDPAVALTIDARLGGKKFVLIDADALASKIVPDSPSVTNDAVMELMRQIVGKCRDRGISIGVTGGFTTDTMQQLSAIGFDQIFSDSA